MDYQDATAIGVENWNTKQRKMLAEIIMPILDITFSSNVIILYNSVLMTHHSNGCFWNGCFRNDLKTANCSDLYSLALSSSGSYTWYSVLIDLLLWLFQVYLHYLFRQRYWSERSEYHKHSKNHLFCYTLAVMNKNEKQMIYYPCVHVVGDLLYTLINETNRESELMNGISLV